LSLRRRAGKRKVCRFCADAELAIDYKGAIDGRPHP
jgi:hypothetical protein